MITRYEIAAIDPHGNRKFLIGYTPRHSRPGLLSAAERVGKHIIAKLSIGEDCRLIYSGHPVKRLDLSNGWTIGFTGRTQLDCRNEGELPFIAA